MEKGLEWLNTVHGACRDISNKAYELLRLSDALGLVGNTLLANDLSVMAKVLQESSNSIPQAIGKYLGDAVQKDQKELGNLLVAIMERK